MASAESPTVRRWELANRLRALREGAGLTLDEVAKDLLCSPSKISRIETAVRLPSARDIRDLARLFGVSDTLRDELTELVQEARQPGWWQSYDQVAAKSATYIGLEDAADEVLQFEAVLVPGLLQAPSYTRALMRRIYPTLGDEGVEQYVETRQERHQRLLRSSRPKNYWVVLDEAVLAREVGGPDVMREQVEFLLQCVADRVLTLQLLPFTAGAHAGMLGSFVILEFDNPAMPDTIYVESLAGELFLNRPGELTTFRQALDHLRALAEGPDDSAALMRARLSV